MKMNAGEYIIRVLKEMFPLGMEVTDCYNDSITLSIMVALTDHIFNEDVRKIIEKAIGEAGEVLAKKKVDVPELYGD